MTRRRDRRRHRADPSAGRTGWGSDPATWAPPDPRSRRRAPAPPPTRRRPASARPRRGLVGTVGHLLFLPFRRVLVSYVRALLRALLPWLLPLALLAALPYILSLLRGH